MEAEQGALKIVRLTRDLETARLQALTHDVEVGVHVILGASCHVSQLLGVRSCAADSRVSISDVG